MTAISDDDVRSMLKHTKWLLSANEGISSLNNKVNMRHATRHMLRLAELAGASDIHSRPTSEVLDSLQNILFGYCVHTLAITRFNIDMACITIRGMRGGARKVTFDGHDYEYKHMDLAEKLSILAGLATAGRSSISLLLEIVDDFGVEGKCLFRQYIKRLFWLRCCAENLTSPYSAFDDAYKDQGNNLPIESMKTVLHTDAGMMAARG